LFAGQLLYGFDYFRRENARGNQFNAVFSFMHEVCKFLVGRKRGAYKNKETTQ
jgi:hypothetical protein